MGRGYPNRQDQGRIAISPPRTAERRVLVYRRNLGVSTQLTEFKAPDDYAKAPATADTANIQAPNMALSLMKGRQGATMAK
jgi:hypothetical protein